MFSGWKRYAAMTGVLAALVGCSHDKPHEYGQQRPPADQIDPRDRGVQSMDLITATDRLAADLVASEAVRDSPNQLTIVVDTMEDLTSERSFHTNYQIFLERLKVNLAKYGHGRIQLIENKSQFHNLRNRELENERDDFGQGAGRQDRPPQAIQPDFSLYGKAMDMPNRATNFYMLEFNLTNLRNRTLAWSNEYHLKTER
jgi:peptidoglycan-synthase activator LpoB